MSIRKYLTSEPLNMLAKYAQVADYSHDNVAFSGAPRKHPYDSEKIILIADPFSTQAVFYEFRIEDIAYVEELPQLVSEEGEALKMVRIWVKKGSFGIRYEPFLVEDTLSLLKDTSFLQNKPRKGRKGV